MKYAGMEYDDVVKLYADDIMCYVLALTKNSEDAKDCFQNTFVKLYQSEKEFKDSEHIKAWLLRVAKNECNDYHRKFWTKNVNLGLEERRETMQTFDISDDTLDLVEALRKLPTKYSSVLILYYYQGYDTNEISKILQTNVNTVKSHLRRARQQLVQLLKDK